MTDKSSASPATWRALLDQATMRVADFANPNIRVVRRDEAEAIIRDALASVPSETPRSEPIAWYTEHDGGGAHCRLTIYEEPKNKVPGVEWIPLYATPVSAVSAIAPRHEIEWVIRSCLDENLMQLWAHKAKVEKIKAWLQSPPSVYEYVCECGVRVTPHRCQTGTEF